jgi:hypothetical protein
MAAGPARNRGNGEQERQGDEGAKRRLRPVEPRRPIQPSRIDERDDSAIRMRSPNPPIRKSVMSRMPPSPSSGAPMAPAKSSTFQASQTASGAAANAISARRMISDVAPATSVPRPMAASAQPSGVRGSHPGGER